MAATLKPERPPPGELQWLFVENLDSPLVDVPQDYQPENVCQVWCPSNTTDQKRLSSAASSVTLTTEKWPCSQGRLENELTWIRKQPRHRQLTPPQQGRQISSEHSSPPPQTTLPAHYVTQCNLPPFHPTTNTSAISHPCLFLIIVPIVVDNN